MTYNVHRCLGRDGKISPQRIAKVIGEGSPDIIALQELDCRLARTGSVDQARVIADLLTMQFHFHACLQMEKGFYGNAVLSRFPLRLVQAEALPTFPSKPGLERRGAVWVEIPVGPFRVQVINTHLGLSQRERLVQAEHLAGPGWLKNPECRPPVVLCGDLNALPASPVHRLFRHLLSDATRLGVSRRISGTWPSLLPLFRIDHVFVSREVKVRRAAVLRTPLARLASDHLPLLAELVLPSFQVIGERPA
jgi:endonuclease/exonuclease/phosphatase family metal-dependent hydrolase